MGWKIVGVIESRSGDVEVMPEWTIGSPNEFQNHVDAIAIRDAMQHQIEKRRQERLAASPGVGGAAGPSISYLVLPVIDKALLTQLHGGAPTAPPPPTVPALSFGPPQR